MKFNKIMTSNPLQNFSQIIRPAFSFYITTLDTSLSVYTNQNPATTKRLPQINFIGIKKMESLGGASWNIPVLVL